MDAAQTKEDNELNETKSTRMPREQSDDDMERLIKASVNWSKESLGVSDEIEDGIRRRLERLQHERPAEEEKSKKRPKESTGCATLV